MPIITDGTNPKFLQGRDTEGDIVFYSQDAIDYVFDDDDETRVVLRSRVTLVSPMTLPGLLAVLNNKAFA